MARGRKITLYLVEGMPNGIIKGQLGNWVGLVTYAPRTKLDDLASDHDTKRPGVYVLTGQDPDYPSNTIVYIGESENVFDRVRQHNKDNDKEFFVSVAVITSTDEHLTKGHIRYIESRLISIAHETKRAKVDNKTQPPQPPLPIADRDEMEVFLDNLQMLLPVMGLNFALPKPIRVPRTDTDTEETLTSEQSPIFTVATRMQGTQFDVIARAQQLNSEFVVLEGSTALDRDLGMSYVGLKKRLIENGSLVREGDILRFVEDVPFSSPTAAAVVIRGKNTNGRTFWKLPDGKNYGDWFDARITAQERNLDSQSD